MKPAEATLLLDAGALLPVKQKIDKDQIADEVSARVYEHSALGQPVVRLTPDALAEGDDLAMEFLGFAAPVVHGPLAKRRRQSLGFPGWALINDPQHARYALELVKEFKKESRRAKSKPGHAYDGIVAIAKRLNRSVAHFLPSFWEEAGRVFLVLGNGTYASRCFGKAREAEKVHALKVDEDHRRDAFLEFALAGCLSIKAITEYGKELESAYDGPEAWRIFRELCVRRTLGGVPPWPNMGKELARLVKAAGLDAEKESLALLEELLESPAMARAATGFWKSYEKPIGKLAAEKPHIAGLLLNLAIACDRWDRDPAWQWLDLLDKWGILNNAWDEKAPKEAQPTGGPTAWFCRYATLAEKPDQRVFDLMTKMADRLRKDGTPLQLGCRNYRGAQYNVDLVDLALELGLPLADMLDEATLDLSEWASPEENAKERPRDPIHLAKDKRFAKLLTEAVAEVAGDDDFERHAEGKRALSDARRAWLRQIVESIQSGALPDVDKSIDVLEDRTTRGTFREFPEAHQVLAKADLASALANTFRGGFIDELGWPALEAAAERLNPDGKNDLSFSGAAPYVIVTNGLKIEVVNREGTVLEHEVRAKKGFEVHKLDFFDGQLYVNLRNKSSYDWLSYWTSDPKKTFEHWTYGPDRPEGVIVDLPDGGSFNGDRAVRAGDSDEPPSGDAFFYDGEHFWATDHDWQTDKTTVHEVAPRTGKKGRPSMPAFFEDYLKDGMNIDFDNSHLLKLGEAAVKDSPLGSLDGLTGWRVRESGDTCHAESIDGRSWEGKLRTPFQTEAPIGLLNLPGDDTPHPLAGTIGFSARYGFQVWIFDAEGKYATCRIGEDAYEAGQAVGLPMLYWHAFQPRDVKTSQKLRKIKDADAAKLLKAVAGEIKSDDEDADRLDLPETTKAIQKLLPKLTDARMLKGILSLVRHAGGLQNRVEALIDGRDPQGEDLFEESTAAEASVGKAMSALGVESGWGDPDPLFPHVQVVTKFFAGEVDADVKLPAAPFHWAPLLDQLDMKAWQAYWGGAGDDDEDEKGDSSAWRTFLTHWVESPILALPGKFRCIQGDFSGTPPFSRKDEEDDIWKLYESKGNRYVLNLEGYEEEWKILEYAPSGKFQNPPKFKTNYEEERFDLGWTPDQLRAFLELSQEKEEPNYLEEELIERLSEGTGVSVAEAGLIWSGFPRFNVWEKNFLPKQLREKLGLKVKDADAARQSLKSLADEVRDKILKLLVDGDPRDLFEDHAKVVDRLIERWGDVVPRRLDLPADVVKKLDDAATWGVNVGTTLESLASSKTHPRFQVGKWEIKFEDDNVELKSDKEDSFDENSLFVATSCLPLLFHSLPVGDPARKSVAEAFDMALKCVKNSNLLLPIGEREFYHEKKQEGFELLEASLGKPKKTKELWTATNGAVTAAAKVDKVFFAFQPNKIKGDKEIAGVRNIAAIIREEMYQEVDTSIDDLRLLTSDGFKALRDRILKTPVPDGCFEANPLVSAPKLVAEVAKKSKVSEDAAAFYLQTLALFDPTAANIKLWNGWTTSQLNKAAKELVEAKLLLEAKRARAGRKHFLPGGWEELKSPRLPIESWKLPLYQFDMASSGAVTFPYKIVLLLAPCHELFERCWKRVQSGDEPKYEDVK